jgi:apolipoprotein N-acyltransferase
MSNLQRNPVFFDVLAFIAGALLTTAYAPLEWWPMAFASLGILFWLWQFDSLKRACWRGFLFGLGLFGAGTSWVFISINEFGHTPAVVAAILTMLFVMLLAFLTPVICAWLYRRFFRVDSIVATLLVLPALWVLTEWLRGWILTGFPWLSVGYSQTDSFLKGIAPLLGVYGVSYAVALIAVLLMLLLTHRERRILNSVILIIFCVVGLLLSGVQWGRPLGKPLQVTLLQGNISQHHKWAPEQRARTMAIYKRLTEANFDSDLIIWPETAVPAFFHDVQDDYLAKLEDEAIASKTDLLIGVPVMQTRGGHRYYYNSMVSVGREQTFYNKQHLVPFGEYVPLGDVIRQFGGFFNLPMSDFSRGSSSQKPMRVAGHIVAVSICYEDAFGDEVIRDLPQASMLVNASNDAWFGDSLAPHQHLQISRMRALETARPMLRATNTGVTAFVGPDGKIIREAPQFAVAAISAIIQPMQGETPYVVLGNYAIVLFALVVLFIVALRSRQSSQAGLL